MPNIGGLLCTRYHAIRWSCREYPVAHVLRLVLAGAAGHEMAYSNCVRQEFYDERQTVVSGFQLPCVSEGRFVAASSRISEVMTTYTVHIPGLTVSGDAVYDAELRTSGSLKTW